MEIVRIETVNMAAYRKPAKGIVKCIHVKIKDIKESAAKIIKSISDTSWIVKLNPIDKASYAARSNVTINKLITDIFAKVESEINDEFGEYLVSESAKECLCINEGHKLSPLAELWKEKKTGNPGFDFHTETPSLLIAFGEAKYSSNSNPHVFAIKQVNRFITEKKDIMELSDLKNFFSDKALNNSLDNKKAYIAAFSINGKNYKKIFDTALNSKHIDNLLNYPELYLIGVEV